MKHRRSFPTLDGRPWQTERTKRRVSLSARPFVRLFDVVLHFQVDFSICNLPDFRSVSNYPAFNKLQVPARLGEEAFSQTFRDGPLNNGLKFLNFSAVSLIGPLSHHDAKRSQFCKPK